MGSTYLALAQRTFAGDLIIDFGILSKSKVFWKQEKKSNKRLAKITSAYRAGGTKKKRVTLCSDYSRSWHIILDGKNGSVQNSRKNATFQQGESPQSSSQQSIANSLKS